MRVFPFRARSRSLILKYGDVLEPAIALQVHDSLRVNRKNAFDFFVAHLRKALIMCRSFDHNFMRADQSHTVVNSIRLAPKLRLNSIKRIKMRHHRSEEHTSELQ